MPKKKSPKVEEEDTVFEPEVEVVGQYPTLLRKKTGLYSFDAALSHNGNMGLPLRCIVELAGKEGSGKSTLAYYLSGVVTETGNISICDIELADPKYVKYATGIGGFKGRVTMIDAINEKQEMIPHEVMMENLVKGLIDENTGAGIFDSVSAIQPLAEKKGDLGEAFMGKRAKLVAQLSRQLSTALREKKRPSSAFVVNHHYQILGSHGHTTAGGVVLPALAGVRAALWVSEAFYSDDHKPYGFVVSGALEKLRFGGKGGRFQFYTVPGFGVHPGVSAMFDCFELGLAERDKSGRVKLDGKSLGYIRTDLLSYAAEGKTRKFLPFLELVSEQMKRDEQING